MQVRLGRWKGGQVILLATAPFVRAGGYRGCYLRLGLLRLSTFGAAGCWSCLEQHYIGQFVYMGQQEYGIRQI